MANKGLRIRAIPLNNFNAINNKSDNDVITSFTVRDVCEEDRFMANIVVKIY